MSHPAPSWPPPAPASNGLAVGALVLGIVSLPISFVPLVNLVAVVTALIGIGLGVAGLRRAGRTGRGRGQAGTGIGLSAVALVVCAVVSFLFFRYLGDLLDWVEPPEPSAEVSEEFRTDDGDLVITVTSVSCPEAGDGAYGRTCEFVFTARNDSARHLYLDHIRVKAIVDGRWQDPSLEGEHSLAPDATTTLTGRVSIGDGRLDGLAFDADDASSHSAVVVDPGDTQ